MECATRRVRFLCAECRGVLSSSMVLWRGFVRWWPCPGFLLVFRFVIGYSLLLLGAGEGLAGSLGGPVGSGGGGGARRRQVAGVAGSVVFFGWAGGGTRSCASWILVSLPYVFEKKLPCVFWVSFRNLAALS